MAEAGGAMTTLALETEEVAFSDTGLRARYRSLTGAARARADRLVSEWGRQRWSRHLTARPGAASGRR